MKKAPLMFSLALVTFAIAAQPGQSVYRFEHTGARAALVKQDKLADATVLADIYPNFPSKNYRNLINYVSVTYTGLKNGEAWSATGKSDTLTADQAAYISNADMGSDILIQIKYTYKDTANDRAGSYRKVKEIELAVTPSPETEAEFPGGQPAMEKYVTEQIINKVPEYVAQEKVAKATVFFTVDEDGKIVEPKIFKTSLDPDIDKMLLEAIRNMPAWKPAQNNKGESVPQNFIVNVGKSRAGC